MVKAAQDEERIGLMLRQITWQQKHDGVVAISFEFPRVFSIITISPIENGYNVRVSGSFKGEQINYDEDATGDYALTVGKLYDGKELLGPLAEILFQATGEIPL